MSIVDSVVDGIDTFFAWLSSGTKQTVESYCMIQTADSETSLVANDGSLMSIMRLDGCIALIGQEEYERVHDALLATFGSILRSEGRTVQVWFHYDKSAVDHLLQVNYKPSVDTAEHLQLDLTDLVTERLEFMKKFCAAEAVYIAMWTTPASLTSEERKRATRDKMRQARDKNFPAFRYTQNVIAAMAELRDSHDSFVRSVRNDMQSLGLVVRLLPVHAAVYAMRNAVDPEFTSDQWKALLPGDKYSPKLAKRPQGDVSDILWPSLAHQIMPREAVNLDLRTVRIGDRLHASVFIDLFPKNVQSFMVLFNKTLEAYIPWRISFLMEGGGMSALRYKRMLTNILAFSSAQNRLVNDAVQLLDYINISTDDAVVRLRVAATTWAPLGEEKLLRVRVAQLARAVQSWGSCDVSQICGDAFAGAVSSMLGVSRTSVATTSVASLSSALYMLPIFRPSSPWSSGALLFRSPDGKMWPYQPGSAKQTTWIDILYARPGSGKSVMSNAINLALALSPGITRLPRISIIDVGPSSSGLISLLQSALPRDKRHLVAYHRLLMTPEHAINPFDTQLGARMPTQQERAFLVNFVTLLSTPLNDVVSYDGMADLVSLVIDESYKQTSDHGNPNVYNAGVEDVIDGILAEISFVADKQTTWWEVTDALFSAGFIHEAQLAQRNAMPLLGDLASVCRMQVVADLYAQVKTPTGESLMDAFIRMISGAVRDFPIISGVTKFDLGDARVVSLDLDEVAKGGGDVGDRQTAVMYMLARHVVAKDFYLNSENLAQFSTHYQHYHDGRISELKEDPKRLVYDEFHRTAKAKAVRTQVVQDMREGRKWGVQVALISQSIEDFDSIMVEFATSIFIMDAGPEQAIKKTAEVFGLTKTAVIALRRSVRGPSSQGSTFLAQFATKDAMNTQLLTLTLGPIELWAFSTTAQDVVIRNKLYKLLGASEARRVLANIFPSGSAVDYIETLLEQEEEDTGLITEEVRSSKLDLIVDEIVKQYSINPNFKLLSLSH